MPPRRPPAGPLAALRGRPRSRHRTARERWRRRSPTTLPSPPPHRDRPRPSELIHAGRGYPGPVAEGSERGIREHVEELMPPGGRARRVVGWGVVAWTGIGALILLGVLVRLLSRVAGVVPYLVMAALVVFVLNPAVRALRRRGLPHAPAATI